MTSRRSVLRAGAAAFSITAAGPALGSVFPSGAAAVAAPGAGHVLPPADVAQARPLLSGVATTVKQRMVGSRPGPSVPAVPAVPALPAGARRATKGLSSDPDLHLLRRATYGPTAASLAELRSMGAQVWLLQQLRPTTIDDSATTAAVARTWPRLSMSSQQLRTVIPQFGWAAMADLVQAHVLRATQSKRQLFELMVDFWSNHLNVTCPHGGVWSVRHLYDSQVIRANALGRFEDMLLASAKHPAMLYYLNNADSRGAVCNENYGRELLEVHTVGLAAGFTEADVRNAALALTGLTVSVDQTDVYTYDATRHYVGPVAVLGWSDPNASANGQAVADGLLKYLANHASTAEHVCRKIAVRFVSDSPSDALVKQLAAVYTASGTAIVPVLQALFASQEFRDSSGQKVRTPLEDKVAALRTLDYVSDGGTETSGWNGICNDLASGSCAPLGWKPPNGYPDSAALWTNPGIQLWRWNAHVSALEGWASAGMHRTGTQWADLFPGVAPPSTMGAVVDAIAVRLLLQTAPRDLFDAALRAVGSVADDPVPDWRLAGCVEPIASMCLSAPLGGLR